MANGETLKEIRAILAGDDKISQPAVNRLILSMQAEIYEAQKDAAAKEDERHARLDADMKFVKENSILIWIRNNKPVATMIGILALIVIMAGDKALTLVLAVVAKMFGIPI